MQGAPVCWVKGIVHFELTEQKEPKAEIHLEQITLRGDSGIHIEDHTLEVPYTGYLGITTLQIKNINSGKPAEPAKVKMIGTMAEKRAPLKIDGIIAPFGEALAMDMTIEVKKLSPAQPFLLYCTICWSCIGRWRAPVKERHYYHGQCSAAQKIGSQHHLPGAC